MLQPDLLARFTHHLKEALQKALAFTIASGRDLVMPGDIIVGLLQEPGSIAAELIGKASIRLEEAEKAFRGLPTPHKPGTPIAPDLSQPVKRLLEKAVLYSHLHEHRYIGTEHVLLAMLEMAPQEVIQFLEGNGFSVQQNKDQIRGVLQSIARFPEFGEKLAKQGPDDLVQDLLEQDDTDPHDHPHAHGIPRPGREKKPKALEIFARELTAPDELDRLDPVIGREQELNRLIEVLCRRTKNNPVLLGEPGTGKTAIVEGLAQRMAAGQVPDALYGKRLYAVDLPLMVAGTMYRGEFEARLKQLVEEVKQDTNVILFIDELHTLVGAGSTSGSMDAANILKPALARGEIRCIGATTYAEYKKHLEPDAALDRRFQPVDVEEPTAQETLAMLKGLKHAYESFHHVQFEKGALEHAVFLATRFLSDRFFPDKAIDIMDEAASLVNARRRSHTELEMLRSLEIAIAAAEQIKAQSMEKGELATANKASKDVEQLRKQHTEYKSLLESERQKQALIVTVHDIAKVVARLSRIPLDVIEQSEQEYLSSLELVLKKKILGQDKAIDTVANAIRLSRLGLKDQQKPQASLLFVGPSGTGKTALAKAMAMLLFGKEEALVKFDMSEFSEGHSVSKMLGSPAGYVGYREGNRLTDAIRKRPHSVILFDEFEKAHPDVQHLLLQALEDGYMTDGVGKKIPLKHSFIVLTSNAGSEFSQRTMLGFGENSNKASEYRLAELKERFKPELLSRLDAIVPFQALDTKTLKQLLRHELKHVLKRFEDRMKVKVTVDSAVLDWLISRLPKTHDGARSVKSTVESEFVSKLGMAMLEKKKKKATVIVSKNDIVVK